MSKKADSELINKRAAIGVRMPSDLQYLPIIGRFIRELSIEWGLDEESAENLKFACHEACVNAIKHGNKFSESLEVALEMRNTADSVSVEITDEGEGFDLACIRNPTSKECLLLPQGRGIFLMKHYVDNAEITAKPGSPTKVKLIKNK